MGLETDMVHSGTTTATRQSNQKQISVVYSTVIADDVEEINLQISREGALECTGFKSVGK